jgi:anti-sigma-K factor RskA
MNTKGNLPLRDLLAAEYALGTLRGSARRRFETWARDDAELRTLAFAWSERLLPLLDDLAPAGPHARVWDAIEARLPGSSAHTGDRPAFEGPSGWWSRIALWRGLSAAFAAVAVIAIGIAMRPQPVMAPQVVQSLPGAVATLVDPKSGKAVAVVMETERADAVVVKVAADVDVPEGKALQLWIAPRDKEALESVGMLPSTARTQATTLVPAAVTMLSRAKAFGLSLEPAGGSQQPTQVLGLGALVRLKS